MLDGVYDPICHFLGRQLAAFPERFLQPLLSELFFVLVRRLDDAIGVEDHAITRQERALRHGEGSAREGSEKKPVLRNLSNSLIAQ